MKHLVVLLGVVLCLKPSLLQAQPASAMPPSNIDVYQQIAVGCVAEAPAAVAAFRLDMPAQMPYLRSALAARWQEMQKQVYLADSTYTTAPPSLPTLEIQIEQAGIDYQRGGRKSVNRAVTLGLRYTLIGGDGQLLQEGHCADTVRDTVPRDQLDALATPAYPETQAEAPPAGWFRRYAQPAVLTAATAVTVYLFFSLRSDSSSNTP